MNLVDISADEHVGDDLMNAKSVCAHFDNITTMTLWRWMRERDFPQPEITIGKLRYWRRRTIQSWRPQKASAA